MQQHQTRSISFLFILISTILFLTIITSTQAADPFAETITGPIIISSPTDNPDIPSSWYTTNLVGMFNGTTTYTNKITTQNWNFKLNSIEFDSITFCLEIWNKKGDKIAYNTTNSCHNMKSNSLEVPINFPASITSTPTIYYFSIVVIIKPISKIWTTETCGELTQNFQDDNTILTYIPIVGARSLGSPGLVLSAPQWRKNYFGTSTFDMTYFPAIDLQLKHVFLNGMLSYIHPVKGYEDVNEHICYINQQQFTSKLIYETEVNVMDNNDTINIHLNNYSHNNNINHQHHTSNNNQQFTTTNNDTPKYYYPVLSFDHSNVILRQNLTYSIQCPTIEVVGKYLNEQLAGLAFLGSIHIIGKQIQQSNDIISTQQQLSLPLSSQQLHSQQLQLQQKSRCTTPLPNVKDSCIEAALRHVYGYIPGKTEYLSTVPVLTFGSNKNDTYPLLSVKNNAVSLRDTVAFVIIILDVRGFDGPSENNESNNDNNDNNDKYSNQNINSMRKSTTQIPIIQQTALQTFFSHPFSQPSTLSTIQQYRNVNNNNKMKYKNSNIWNTQSLMNRNLDIFQQEQSSLSLSSHKQINKQFSTMNNNNQLGDDTNDDEPSISCKTTNYRFDHILINVTSISLEGISTLVHSEIFSTTQLTDGILLHSLSINYQQPKLRYHITLQSLRTVDISTHSNYVQIACHLTSPFGYSTPDIISHASITTPIAHTIDFPILVINNTQHIQQQQQQLQQQQQQQQLSLSQPSSSQSSSQLSSLSQPLLDDLPYFYATFNFSLIQPQVMITTGIRLTWFGHHTFYLPSINNNQCGFIGYNNNNKKITNFIPITNIIINDPKVELSVPIEHDPLIQIPDYIPQNDTNANYYVEYITLYVQLNNTIPYLYSYNLTCTNEYNNQAIIITKKFHDNGIFSTSHLRFEVIEETKTNNNNDDEETIIITNTQSIQIPIFATPPPIPPEPDNDKAEDNTVFFLIFFIVLILAIIGSIIWLCKLKQLRDKQRQAVIEQQQKQHDQMVSYEYGYQLVN